MKLEVIQPTKKSKYNNKKCWVGNKKFDSIKEGSRYIDLCYLQKAGKISQLKTQASFGIVFNNQKICSYRADFVYNDISGKLVVEDVKGCRTAIFKLKKKLLFAFNGIEIQEI